MECETGAGKHRVDEVRRGHIFQAWPAGVGAICRDALYSEGMPIAGNQCFLDTKRMLAVYRSICPLLWLFMVLTL